MRLPPEETASLPPLYAGWLDTLLAGPIPAETEATCDNCAMCAPAGEPNRGALRYFHPATKCCTYMPSLPNFLVGRLLLDEDPAMAVGRARVEAGLTTPACTPWGVDASPTHQLLYVHALEAFGRNRALRCPYYREEEGGLCGIWRHRNATCATWFCKHVRGAVGVRFWQAVHRLLTAVERGLAGWCLLELALDAEALECCFSLYEGQRAQHLDAADLDGTADPAAQRAFWGEWWGREAEFFRECARRVSPLTWDQVTAIGGLEVTALARLARAAYEDLVSEKIPDALQVGKVDLIQLGADACIALTYRDHDPVRLSRRVLEVLHHFDGRPTEAALQGITAQEGVRLDPSLVRKLVDFQVLVPPPRGVPRAPGEEKNSLDRPGGLDVHNSQSS